MRFDEIFFSILETEIIIFCYKWIFSVFAHCAIFGWPSFVRLPRKEFIYLGNWVTEHIYYSMSNFLYIANCFFVISGLFLKSTLINFLHLKRSLDKMFFCTSMSEINRLRCINYKSCIFYYLKYSYQISYIIDSFKKFKLH